MKSLSKIILLLSVISVLLTGCGGNATSISPETKNEQTSAQEKTSGKRIITDMSGKKVEIPDKIQRIGDAWPAHNEVVCILGYGSKIVATIHTPKDRPWLYKVNPEMKNSLTTFTKTDVNMEELIKTKPDLVFMPTSYNYVDKLTSVGIPAICLNFTNFEELKTCFKLTGEILGPEAIQRAEKYVSYLDSKLKAVKDVSSKIPAVQKPKVLHINALNPLTVDGKDTIIDSWIDAAGGINAASEISGNMKQVSMEQVLKWNPDIIIFQSDIKDAEDTLSSDTWKKVAAVQKGKVFRNPDGAFLWDRYGAEEALQIQWAAKTLHPDKFSNINIIKETIDFYKNFLDYNLSEEEAKLILSGKPPVKAQ